MSAYSYSSYPSTSYGQYSSRPLPSSTYYGSTSYPSSQTSYLPPQPDPHQERETFRTWCSQQLSTLVENNRTVIHGLSYMAQQNMGQYAPVVAQCIEQHIRRVHPSIKLPAWYLLDSISKNLGTTYTSLFASFVTPLFLESYDLVDDSTRNKMEEMLVTWRTGGPGGVELFGHGNQVSIERAVWGDHTSPGSGVSGPTRSQVLMELDVILTQKTRAVQLNARDVESRTHIDVLHQLRGMVQNTTMSPSDLNAIVTRLRDLARSTASSAPPVQAAVPLPPQSLQPLAAFVPTPPPVSTSYSLPPSAPAAATPDLSFLSSLLSQAAPPPAAVPMAPSSSSTPSIPDVSELFKNLVAAGIIPSSNAASSSDVVAPKIEPILEPTEKIPDPRLVAMRKYEKRVMSIPIALSGVGLQRLHPILVSMMYEELPLKCKQCSKRFADTELGARARDDHLDAHFRQNKRVSHSVGRGHCRSWFVGIEDWVHDLSISANEALFSDATGKGRAELPPTSAKAIAAAAAEQDTKLRRMYVIVPPGDESKGVRCPVCKEELVREFKYDDEEWVWKNAISVKGKVYHATCHADALASSATARLRDQTSAKLGSPRSTHSRSRSGTPEAAAIKAAIVRRSASPPLRAATMTSTSLTPQTPPRRQHTITPPTFSIVDTHVHIPIAPEPTLSNTSSPSAMTDAARASSSSPPPNALRLGPSMSAGIKRKSPGSDGSDAEADAIEENLGTESGNDRSESSVTATSSQEDLTDQQGPAKRARIDSEAVVPS